MPGGLGYWVHASGGLVLRILAADWRVVKKVNIQFRVRVLLRGNVKLENACLIAGVRPE